MGTVRNPLRYSGLNNGAYKMSIYTEKGYKDRKDYLERLADDYGIDEEMVFAAASILGTNEDFDGLVSALEDYQ